MLERQHGLGADWWDCGETEHAPGTFGRRLGGSEVGGAGHGGGERDGAGSQGAGGDGGGAHAWQRVMTVLGFGFRVRVTGCRVLLLASHLGRVSG